MANIANDKMLALNNEKEYVIKGKYKLLNYVKGGGFGDIFFARHIEKNYEVAIKFVIFVVDRSRVTLAMKRRRDNMRMRWRH